MPTVWLILADVRPGVGVFVTGSPAGCSPQLSEEADQRRPAPPPAAVCTPPSAPPPPPAAASPAAPGRETPAAGPGPGSGPAAGQDQTGLSAQRARGDGCGCDSGLNICQVGYGAPRAELATQYEDQEYPEYGSAEYQAGFHTLFWLYCLQMKFKCLSIRRNSRLPNRCKCKYLTYLT